MKTKTGLAVLIVCLAAVSQASAQYCELETTRYRSQGDGVTADFSSVDKSTCSLGVETTVHVEGALGEIHLEHLCGSGPMSDADVTDTVTNVAVVVISVTDRCLGTVRSITGSGPTDDIHVAANRKTGSLIASIAGLDEHGNPVAITVDLVWNGVGRKERTSDRINANLGIYRLIYNSSGTIRDAGAAGSVTIDGVDITPNQSTRGTIEKNVTRSFEEYR